MYNTINRFQLFVLVFTFIIGNTILNAPSLIVSLAKQDAWISGILAMIIGIGLVLLYNLLAEIFPNKTIVEYVEILLGEKIGKLVSLLLVFYFLILASLMIRQLGDFILVYILPETPVIYIFLSFIFIIVMGTYLGIVTLARTGEIFFPFLLVLLIFLFLMLFEEKDISNLKPVLEGGISPVIKGTFAFISIPYLQLVVFLMIFPNVVKGTKSIKKPVLLGVISAGFFLIVSILHSLLIIGPILSEYKQYPIYFLTQKIHIGDIIQRIEVLLAIIWIITIFLKTSIFLYASQLGISQIFSIKDRKLIVISLGFMLFTLSHIITPNIVFFDDFFKYAFPPFSLTFGLILPLILVLISKFKKFNAKTERN